jgi:hypothetical protein
MSDRRPILRLAWRGLRIGDVVAIAGRARRMIIVDLDLDDPGAVTCAWACRRPYGRGLETRERTFRASAMILIRRPADQHRR